MGTQVHRGDPLFVASLVVGIRVVNETNDSLADYGTVCGFGVPSGSSIGAAGQRGQTSGT